MVFINHTKGCEPFFFNDTATTEIYTVDAQLAALFERRMAAVLQVAEYKRAHGLPIYDAAREPPNLRVIHAGRK